MGNVSWIGISDKMTQNIEPHETIQSLGNSFYGIQMWHVLFLLAIIVTCFVIYVVIPYSKRRNQIYADNFRVANEMFFKEFDSKVIVIYDMSLSKKTVENNGDWVIEVRPIDLSSRDNADRKNMWAHLNYPVLIFACNEILNGDKQLGVHLLELLKKHDPEQRYNYSSGKKSFFGGYSNKIISLDELLNAASKMLNGEDSGKILIEKPSSQWSFIKSEYGKQSNK
ncbi:hypothetical protein ACFL54_05450 [Planctomycetota bacterium]